MRDSAVSERPEKKWRIALASTFSPSFGSDRSRYETSRVGLLSLVKTITNTRLAWYLQRNALSPARKYPPLRDGMIRLLQIRPGHTMSTIECNLLSVDLHHAGDYAALSYTWGQIAPSIPTLVNGSITLISENLYLALLHLRKREDTTLWVDAICINQDDLAERATQVGHMKDIYENASIVFIWLGENNKLSERAFEELYGLSLLLTPDEHGNSVVPGREFDRNTMEQDPQKWAAISDILYRPWFRRMWIIQEALSAQHAVMMCGSDTLDLVSFLTVIFSMLKAGVLQLIMSHHPNRHKLSKRPIQVALKQLEFFVKAKFEKIGYIMPHRVNPPLLSYLAETRWAEATDPRDKIYGILSLAGDSCSLGYWHAEGRGSPKRIPFKPDYNLSKAEVFINTTKAILCTTNSLKVLRFVKHKSIKTSGLPSWVPDWSSEEPHTVPEYLPLGPLHTDEDTNKEQYWNSNWRISSSGSKKCPAHYEITQHCQPSFSLGDGNTLTVTGFHFDTITAVSQHTYPQDETIYSVDPLNKDSPEHTKELHDLIQRHLESTYRWIKECMHHAAQCVPYPTGQSAWSSLWRTLNGDVTQDNETIPEGCEILLENIRKAQTIFTIMKDHDMSYQSGTLNSLSEIAAEAAYSNMPYILSQLPTMTTEFFSWRFAATRNKYMGLVPNEGRVGDIICVIYGCEMPFILRTCGRNRYEFIGHCLIQGFSFDEAVVDSSIVLQKGKKQTKKGSHFSILNEAGRRVYMTLKKTREFTLV